LALADVMLATVGNLGYVADVQLNAEVRSPLGNDLYGAFGRDFHTKDGRYVMLAAISNRQWRAIGKATGLADRLNMIGPLMQVDMATEGGRFAARGAICAVLEPWFASRSLADIRTALDGSGVLWGPYQDFGQLVHEDTRCSTANPIFAEIEQPGIGRVLANACPLGFSLNGRLPPAPAPRLGEHTETVLTELLGLSAAEYGKLRDAGIVNGASS
jgi:2-methylfumaryl-CoA isomerase